MIISVLKETFINEQRVAASPESIKLLHRLGAEILVESGAGILSQVTDVAFSSAGAKIVSHLECLKTDICLCVRMPSDEDINQLNIQKKRINLKYKYVQRIFFLS